jgi:uncharacterized protein (DUF362 family)
MNLTSSVKIPDNTTESFKRAISKSLELIDFSFPRKIEHVVIKPNMCYYWDYTTGQTTDPKFVAALITLLRERLTPEIDIAIVESDASAMKCKHAFRMLGYEKMARDYDVKLINLSEDLCDNISTTVESELFNIAVPRTIQKADLKINLPKIKYTMEPIKITCALKNIFGCNPYPRKFRYHPRLEETIVAVNKTMKFDLVIVDGNIVSGVQTRRLGLVMASKDPVAIDAGAAKIAGINPRIIRYLKLAEKEGLGRRVFVPRGVSLNYFEERYPRKTVSKKLMGRAYTIVTKIGLGKRLGIG